MLLSIIIVNYNAKYFLEQCLLSVRAATAGIEAEIIVADNNSADESVAFFSGGFPDIKFIWLPENAGFAKANNIALAGSSGKYVLFLNPDTIVPETGLRECIDFFENNADCGALGVRMIDGSGKYLPESKRNAPNLRSSFFKSLGLGSAGASSYYAIEIAEKEISKVDVLSGAFLMISRAALNSVKGFDESYFMYGEDIDLSLRIAEGGFGNYYNGAITIIHFKGESANQNVAARQKSFYGAMNIFAEKKYANRPLKKVVARAGIAFARLFSAFRNKRALTPTIPGGFALFDNGCAEELRSIIAGSAYSNIRVVAGDKFAARKEKDATCVFCAPAQQTSSLIAALEQNSGEAAIHIKGSRSILCSGDRNRAGLVISTAM